MKYRKRPLVVEGWRYTGQDRFEWPEWLRGHPTATNDLDWSRAGVSTHIKDAIPFITVGTPEGVMRVDVGDYVILGIKGEVYPCKADIFDLSYEPVTESSHA
ncbi:hypothetical protein NL532_10210 [Mesorhizobium sp. C120A]|uniref:hypothetical protein n=1 Tax=unclassified Mesorhizobium TaxID=325217 RepID=UPI0003D05343|nr:MULTISPECIES: hypothetical protein [unclassified Mesorhizobium]ESZ66325.1 sugar ABC transporter substrate-binding protein [Mesorhizobium sp. L103C120A0]WJI48340.1 hypothetical protein NL532_10210 [Mesorhizobium sp. C120A]